jgi:hypothetical protein
MCDGKGRKISLGLLFKQANGWPVCCKSPFLRNYQIFVKSPPLL